MLHPRLFAGKQHVFKRQRPVQLAHDAVHLGRQEHAGDPPLSKQFPEHVHVFPFRFIGNVYAAAEEQGKGQVDQGRDKAEARDAQGTSAFG